jgi:hypothetical protein
MKVCIEISEIKITLPNGRVLSGDSFDSGHNRLEVIMALIEGKIKDMIDEDRMRENARRREKATRSDRQCTWTEEDEENAIVLEFPKMKSTWD